MPSSGRPLWAEGDPVKAAALSPTVAASISSLKISGRPVTHSINRNAVAIRLVHLWIRNQVRMVRRVTTGDLPTRPRKVNANDLQ